MAELVTLDGSEGEGGGQILRSSLALSALLGRPIELKKIRAKRSKPGLARQHLACVRAAAEICQAEVTGDSLRSQELLFSPTSSPKSGSYRFDIGTAGSTGLVLQTVIWPLLAASGDSVVTVLGGTHNPMSPPFDFLKRTFLPAARLCGAEIELTIERHGFYPRGGGCIRAEIRGGTTFAPITLLERGPSSPLRATIISARLPEGVVSRESDTLVKALDIEPANIEIRDVEGGPGNAVHIELGFENVTEIVSAFGDKGVPAERVARSAAVEADTYLSSNAPVGEHLADQLIIPMALAKGGEIACTTPSLHTRTNLDVVGRFLDTEVSLTKDPEGTASYRMRAQ